MQERDEDETQISQYNTKPEERLGPTLGEELRTKVCKAGSITLERMP